MDRETSNLSKSQQLAQAMLVGTPIIVCTLQTFPYAQEGILGEKSLRDRRYVLTGQSEDEWESVLARMTVV